MARKSKNVDGATKRERKQQPKYFLVELHGTSHPRVVVSFTKKAAVDAVMRIGIPTHGDLIEAVRHPDCEIIDLTKPAQQMSFVTSSAPLMARGAVGSLESPTQGIM